MSFSISIRYFFLYFPYINIYELYVKVKDQYVDGQKAILTKLIDDKEAANGQNVNQKSVKEVILSGKGTAGATGTEESFDYLQKHDTVKLAKIRDEQPEQYAALAKAYGQGVRHTSK